MFCSGEVRGGGNSLQFHDSKLIWMSILDRKREETEKEGERGVVVTTLIHMLSGFTRNCCVRSMAWCGH